MPDLPTVPQFTAGEPPESRLQVPPVVARLLSAPPGPESEAAWSAFLAVYSDRLLRVASTFGPGYDDALDRYAHMLDELRRSDCRRLRGFVADGRSRFSTWLVVVARRLCLDQYRLRYGRARGGPQGTAEAARTTRRRLSDLAVAVDDLTRVPDPALPDPVEQLDARERRQALARAVALLAPGDQLLLRLRFEDELTAREIASLLGLPTPFHVYRRLASVCARLRVTLGSTPVARPA